MLDTQEPLLGNDEPLTSEIDNDIDTQDDSQPAERTAPEDDYWAKEAYKQGWRPDKYSPEDPRYKDPKTFVIQGERIRERELERLERIEKQLELQRQEREKEKKASIQRDIEQYNNIRLQAVAEGDTEKFKVVENKIRELSQQAAPTPQPQQNTPQELPEVSEFKQRNAWYGQDKQKTVYARSVVARIEMELQEGLRGPMSNAEILAIAESETLSRFKMQPQSFTPPVNRQTPTTNQRTKKTYNDLNHVQKTVLDRMLRSPRTAPKDDAARKQMIAKYVSEVFGE